MSDFYGTDGNDRIEQSSLNLAEWSSIYGLAGDDVIFFSVAAVEGGPGNDSLTGLSISSTVKYDSSPSSIEADLEAGWVKDGWGTKDTLLGIRVIADSPFADTIFGSRHHDIVWASQGDFVDGRAGNDVLVFWRPSAECSWYVTNSGELYLQHHLSGQAVRAVNIEGLRFQDRSLPLPIGNGESRVVFSDGSGLSSQAVATQVKPLDINSDGLLDLVVVSGTAPPESEQAYIPRLLLQNADGTFREGRINGPRTAMIGPGPVAEGDFNRDGFKDILIAGSGYDAAPFPGERSALILSDGKGGWIDSSALLPSTPAFTHSVSVADVNRDGFDDIYLGNIGGQQFEPPRLLMGESNGFQSSLLPRLAGDLALTENGALPVGSLLNDLDSDGYIDLVVGGGNSVTMIFWGKNGSLDGHWFQESPWTLPSGRFGADGKTITVHINSADVNNDGLQDLLLSQTRQDPSYEDRAIQILLQGAGRVFSDKTNERLPNFDVEGRWIVYLTVLDLNGDGFLDIQGSTQEMGVSQGAMAWLNDGNGVFWEPNEQSGFTSRAYGIPVWNGYQSILAVSPSENGAITVTRLEFPEKPSNQVVGKLGPDVFSLDRPQVAFNIEPFLDGWRIWTKYSDGSMPVVLHGVERLKFADNLVALDTNGVAGQGYRIYKAAFDRTPDGSGLGYWIAQMDKGMNVTEVAARFIDSPEFRSLYGQNPSNAEFLTKVYTNVLGRKPDQGGYSWWLNELNTNPDKTRQKVLADFSESQENKDSVASLIGNGIQYVEFTG